MTFGSLFSGIGGFDLGLERAGLECLWQVEYDEQAQSVLRRHWPDVDLYKDVCDVGGLQLRAGCGGRGSGGTDAEGDGVRRKPHERRGPTGNRVDTGRNDGRTALAPVDLICGGFPCQDLSVAGKREGLAGERSGLWWEFHRIIGELAPRWVLIENVPGLLSSNEGRDMEVVLRGLEELGYGWTYRVLDSQYFGVAQRRRRVFIVGCSGGGPRPEILFEPESVPWHPAPIREAGTVTANALANGSGKKGGPDDNAAQGHHLVAHPIAAQEQKGPDSDATSGMVLTPALRVGGREQGAGDGPDNTPIVAQSLAIRGREGTPQAEVGADGQANAILTPNGGRGGIGSGAVFATVPRRLTPRECERLQAFPDDWTRYADDGTELADSPRYRMLGNAVTVNVAYWIGQRIMEAP